MSGSEFWEVLKVVIEHQKGTDLFNRPLLTLNTGRGFCWGEKQVDKVGHQAVGINFYTQCFLEFSQVREVALEVRWLCENDLPVAAALHDVMRVVR